MTSNEEDDDDDHEAETELKCYKGTLFCDVLQKDWQFKASIHLKVFVVILSGRKAHRQRLVICF